MEQMWITHPREFTFQLFDENNNLIDTKKNTDNGSAATGTNAATESALRKIQTMVLHSLIPLYLMKLEIIITQLKN